MAIDLDVEVSLFCVEEESDVVEDDDDDCEKKREWLERWKLFLCALIVLYSCLLTANDVATIDDVFEVQEIEDAVYMGNTRGDRRNKDCDMRDRDKFN